MTKDGKFRGINEGLTEYLNQEAGRLNETNPGNSGYDDIVKAIKSISTLIDMDEGYYAGQGGIKVLGDIYFGHDANQLKGVLKNLLSNSSLSAAEIEECSSIIFEGLSKSANVIANQSTSYEDFQKAKKVLDLLPTNLINLIR